MLFYNFNQCTGGSRQEFYELTLGEVTDMIVTYINVNGKKKNGKNNKTTNIRQGEKETFFKVDIKKGSENKWQMEYSYLLN